MTILLKAANRELNVFYYFSGCLWRILGNHVKLFQWSPGMWNGRTAMMIIEIFCSELIRERFSKCCFQCHNWVLKRSVRDCASCLHSAKEFWKKQKSQAWYKLQKWPIQSGRSHFGPPLSRPHNITALCNQGLLRGRVSAQRRGQHPWPPQAALSAATMGNDAGLRLSSLWPVNYLVCLQNYLPNVAVHQTFCAHHPFAFQAVSQTVV